MNLKREKGSPYSIQNYTPKGRRRGLRKGVDAKLERRLNVVACNIMAQNSIFFLY